MNSSISDFVLWYFSTSPVVPSKSNVDVGSFMNTQALNEKVIGYVFKCFVFLQPYNLWRFPLLWN